MSDYLEDAREERFCQYVVVHGSTLSASYQKAFRLDCGLPELRERDVRALSDELGGRDYIKARIGEIKRKTEGAGKLTRELLALELEKKLNAVLSDGGTDSKDRLYLARTAVVLVDSLKKLKGWEDGGDGGGITLTLNRVFPAGFKGEKNGKTVVRMDFVPEEQNEGVLCKKIASGLAKRSRKVGEDED